MSEERIAKLEQSLLTLRKRVEAVSRGQRATHTDLIYAVLASVLAGVVAALTASTWRHAEDTDTDRTYVDTLWGMAAQGWQGALTLLLLAALVFGTLAVFLTDEPHRRAHLGFVVVALLAALGVLLVGGVEADGIVEAEDYDTAPARWLALVGTLALAAVHGARASTLK
ncbi:hypothetical protein [Actinophytocola gossypii]|uniref:Uncharacterized protein n=1 Tax=Actinophytocola gossypii TaxID=2812003 RepID=A0ABT2JID0_9PSEU|nr:hypothetical protein [Actinophytocola gossypii]MCT2587508.1 hypothetical protein [Actinophytocola gossypii]